jgi:hypothetical protein
MDPAQYRLAGAFYDNTTGTNKTRRLCALYNTPRKTAFKVFGAEKHHRFRNTAVGAKLLDANRSAATTRDGFTPPSEITLSSTPNNTTGEGIQPTG